MEPSINTLKTQVWDLQTEPKIKMLIWKMLSGAIPVTELLVHKGLKIDDCCQVCGEEGESINHVIFNCSLSRQIWAMAGYPFPRRGFDQGTIFSNVNHLLQNRNNPLWPEDVRKRFPWIVWRIWKKRNLFIFEGRTFSADETSRKIREDVIAWTDAQNVLLRENQVHEHSRRSLSVGVNRIGRSIWKPPQTDWLKCNVGCSWSKRNGLVGAAWVLRNESGLVLLHSRRAFANVKSKDEARLLCVVWAIESVASHRVNRVIFAIEPKDLCEAVNRPKAWPSFRFQASEIRIALRPFLEWKLMCENHLANRGAALIASSVTNDCRLQSYVARSHPSWLNGMFVSERACPLAGAVSVCG